MKGQVISVVVVVGVFFAIEISGSAKYQHIITIKHPIYVLKAMVQHIFVLKYNFYILPVNEIFRFTKHQHIPERSSIAGGILCAEPCRD